MVEALRLVCGCARGVSAWRLQPEQLGVSDCFKEDTAEGGPVAGLAPGWWLEGLSAWCWFATAGTRTFAFDNAGNMTSRTSHTGGTQTLGYNHFNRLKTIDTASRLNSSVKTRRVRVGFSSITDMVTS